MDVLTGGGLGDLLRRVILKKKDNYNKQSFINIIRIQKTRIQPILTLNILNFTLKL